MLKLREYQSDAVANVYRRIDQGYSEALIELPTGAGKTPVIARLCQLVTKWGMRAVVLAHVKELLEQTYRTIKVIDSALDVGLYSAGLDSRCTDNRIICAGIQSVYKRANEIGRVNIVIVDEAHLIPKNDNSMYQTFLSDMKKMNDKLVLVGLTATPYRTDSGVIFGEGELFQAVTYRKDVKELIDDGYLSPLRSRNGSATIKESELTLNSAGEFDASVQAKLLIEGELLECAIMDIANKAKDRKKILVFCPKIEICNQFADLCRQAFCDRVEVVTKDTSDAERAEFIKDFRDGDLRILVNCQVLTTGFDAPNVDCVILLRATTSPGLYYQMVGRGLRKAPGKKDCLILDYGKNIERHGAINAIQVRKSRKGDRNSKPAPIVKECPQCGELIGVHEKVCPVCKYEYPAPELKIETESSEKAIVDESETSDYTVLGVEYTVPKEGKRPYTRFVQAIYTVKESRRKFFYFLGIEYDGYARDKFVKWVKQHTDEAVLNLFGGKAPETCEAFTYMAEHFCFAVPNRIRVKFDPEEKYPEIKKIYVDHKPTLEEINEKIAQQKEAENQKRESGYY